MEELVAPHKHRRRSRSEIIDFNVWCNCASYGSLAVKKMRAAKFATVRLSIQLNFIGIASLGMSEVFAIFVHIQTIAQLFADWEQ